MPYNAYRNRRLPYTTIAFYKNCGFVYSHRIPNFFTDNYEHPIFEAGKQLKDMIYLKISISK